MSKSGPHNMLLDFKRWGLKSGISLLDFFFLFFPQSSPCLRPWQVYKCRLRSYLSGWYIKNTSSHFLLVKINNRYRQRVVGIITGDGYSLRGSFSADRRWKNLQRTELFLGYKTHQQEGGNKESLNLLEYTVLTLETRRACGKDCG